ncbi:MAG: hypothetical protein QG608_1536 [Actinomycetota bacterium]|nr:hypothetical protein [Actinomycetota bacterium]
MTYPQDSGTPDGSACLLPVLEPDFPTLLLGEKSPLVLRDGSGAGPGPGDPGGRGGRGEGNGDPGGGLRGPRRRRVPVWRRGWFLAVAGLGAGFCAGVGTVYATGTLQSRPTAAGVPGARPPSGADVSGATPVPRASARAGKAVGSAPTGPTGTAGTAGTAGSAGTADLAGGGAFAGASPRGSRIAGTGVFLVGKEVRPGTYRTSGGATCYWARLRATDGTLESIIANGVPSAQAVVTVQASDKAFDTANCGVWERVE